MRIAVLLTCFNRKQKTLDCLTSLYSIDKGFFEIFLVDDGSIDGTSKAVKRSFPNVNILNGNGNLFWSRGMLEAWKHAFKYDFDFYLWMNDDVELLSKAIDELLFCSKLKDHKAIISGLILDKGSGNIIYGGYDKNKKLIEVSGTLQDITYLNGNVVLIPKSIPDTIGLLDPIFHHDLGDVEYGLRAIKNGFEVLSTREAVALGYANSICRERKNGVHIVKRFKILYSPLGSNPFINFYYRKKYQSTLKASIYFVFQHFLNLIPDKLNTFLFKNKYT
ncbi:glycosyltransferase family 2 protein [Leeuwenhoekiella sp. CH_XMU1409-2]|uniref:glycosyltransferase family 2 protein n=1 Tax=Leeuwenhoekiella sp. CH_XMU1409-2 TaxID=3107768 RepID=UPI0030089ABD